MNIGREGERDSYNVFKDFNEEIHDVMSVEVNRLLLTSLLQNIHHLGIRLIEI